GSSVRAQVSGLLEYRDYLGGAFGNEFRGTMDAVVDWTLIPDRLKWGFADNLGLNPINLRQPDTPDNLQQTNVFTTGPTLQFRLGQATTGLAELRYTDSYAENTDQFNSGRTSAAFRALRELDSTRRLSGNLEVSDINYDNNSEQTDYKRYAGYAGYTQKLTQLDLDLALGYTSLDFTQGDNADGPLIRAKLAWRASPQSTFGLGVYRDISDVVSNLVADTSALIDGFGNISVGGEAISPDVFKSDRVAASYGFESTRISLTSAVSADKVRYVSDNATDSNRNEFGAELDLGYKLRPNLTLGILAGFVKRDYKTDGGDTRDTLFGAYLRHQMSRHWGWRLDLNRNERNGNGDNPSYNENRAFARLIYSR
ncbi:MAG TPA: hypothetical protein VFN25_07115, partial [Dokdonella sp.]|uniref:hypothetical protein n=1 Tax=Dokdonella sp. TaxID=2291710 RepID=UPI002D7EFBEE